MAEETPNPGEQPPILEEALPTVPRVWGGAALPLEPSRSALPVGSQGPLPLRTRDQVLLAAVSGIALLAMAAYCVRSSHWGADPIELDRQPEHRLDYKIDLNSATWVEWSQLPGIGVVLAHRIVEERERNGPFRDLADLRRVKGLGPKRIEAIRLFVRVEPPANS